MKDFDFAFVNEVISIAHFLKIINPDMDNSWNSLWKKEKKFSVMNIKDLILKNLLIVSKKVRPVFF